MKNTDNSLHRYKIRKKIGVGGMASVFLADDTVLNRQVALKMVHPHLMHQPETIRRFANEAQAIATLSHENIIKIFDFGDSRSRPFIVMEYIEGVTLEALLEREGFIPPLVTIGIASQVLAGLICAHSKGIYHRDIKPANILIDRNGCLRITDFGIAYLVNAESVTVTGSFIGSPHYISPEQVSNKPVQGTTDVFSLGIILYRCCTGILPFNADTPHGVIHEILTTDPPSPVAAGTRQVLLWFADIIESCLTKNAADRPDAREVLARLEARCRADSIRSGKDRLAAFVHDGPSVQAAETAELFARYREIALAALEQRRIVAGLRAFEQAACFGTLPATDRKRINRIALQSRMRRIVLIGGVLLSGIIFVVLTVLTAIARRDRVSGGVPVVEVPETDSGFRSNGLPDTIPATANPLMAPADPVPPKRQPGAPAGTVIVPAATDVPESAVTIPEVPASRSTGTDRAAPEVPVAGFVKCFTNPPWATIYIDNIERGKTPMHTPITLLPGKHTVRIVKPQCSEVFDTFTVVPAETTLVRVRLLPGEQDTLKP